jgi:hypothetical protein
MILPRIFPVGKCLRQGFTLLVVAGLLWIGAGEKIKGQALAAGCTGSQGRCAFLPLVDRTPDPRKRAESLSMFQDMYLGSEPPALGWGGGDIHACQAGNISQYYRDAVLMRVNYFRLMAGVPNILSLRSEYNQQTQAAALMMSANSAIDHEPPTDWTCYSPLGSEGARYSNMVGHLNGPDAVNFYMKDEGDTLVALRRFVIYPQTLEMGDGEVPVTSGHMSVNALRVIDDHYFDPRPNTRDVFVSWPPAAYVPYQVVYTLWSFSYAGADFSQASVNMTKNGAIVSINRYDQVDGFGENTLVWKAGNWGPWPKPGADTSYTVSIRNVLVNGHMRGFTYQVIVFDPGP